MKSLVLYPYPVEYDGQSLQGHYLMRGLRELGMDSLPCGRGDADSKKLAYENFKPDVVFGIGYWGDTPDLVFHPKKYGLIPVPWFNADGWVANYQKELNELPLILATSNWVKSTYIRDGVKPDNIQVAPIGYDPSVFYPRWKYDSAVRDLRASLGVGENELMILTIGGDVTSKGAQEILKALGKIKDKIPKWKYVCKTWPSVSTRGWRKMEDELIEKFGFQDNVKYIAGAMHSERIATLLNACDIYAAPSRLEGFGMIQLEAQACGKPVVSINVGGPADTIVHGKTGFLAEVGYENKLSSNWVTKIMGFERAHKIKFPEPKTFDYQADIDQLADALFKLMTDFELREKMGKAAAKHALENFNYRVTARHISNLVKEYVLKEKPGAEIESSNQSEIISPESYSAPVLKVS
ncbi:MAG: glycosyltransferase family 4 protein [Nanoarchaeota archaeon]|nr:glycosyltransferase family 4 protein [Nanoarchaeota archaeon]MBU1104119.1 glycosyltransferase family 4 protein [Nanoarchaeota archaeon]